MRWRRALQECCMNEWRPVALARVMACFISARHDAPQVLRRTNRFARQTSPTMAEAAPGRVGICVSVGNLLNLRESGVPHPEKPVRVIREYVEALRALWNGETVDQEGLIWQLRGARLAFKPPKPIPIF